MKFGYQLSVSSTMAGLLLLHSLAASAVNSVTGPPKIGSIFPFAKKIPKKKLNKKKKKADYNKALTTTTTIKILSKIERVRKRLEVLGHER
jgi:hypothetical protein